MEHIKLIASEGMVLTNGTDYARIVYVGTGDSINNWYEITDAEYAEILAEQEAKAQEII